MRYLLEHQQPIGTIDYVDDVEHDLEGALRELGASRFLHEAMGFSVLRCSCGKGFDAWKGGHPVRRVHLRPSHSVRVDAKPEPHDTMYAVLEAS